MDTYICVDGSSWCKCHWVTARGEPPSRRHYKMPTADTHGLPWTPRENCCEFAAAPMWIVVLNSVMWPTKTSQRPLTLRQADNGTSVLKESALWKWFDFFLNLFVCLCALLWWARALERAKWTRERESCCGGGCYYLSHTHYLSFLSHYVLTSYSTLLFTLRPKYVECILRGL